MGICSSNMEVDKGYISNPKEGILHIITIALNLIGAIFVFSCSYHFWSSDLKFFLFTSMTALIVSLILFVLKALQFSKQITYWSWICMGFDALWAFFYLIASNVIIKWIRVLCHSLGGGVFFGYLSLICYLCDLFFRFLQMKSNQAQGGSGDNPDSNGSPQVWTTSEPLPKY